jgi:N-acetylglucosamine-6-sulfatase
MAESSRFTSTRRSALPAAGSAMPPRGRWLAAALIALCVSCGDAMTRGDSPDTGAPPGDAKSKTADRRLAATTAAANAKNVVFILLDDLDKATFDQLRAHPDDFPNITRLLAEGTYFTEAFVSNSVCCPARATYLTGQYSRNNGTYALGDGRLGATTPFGGVQAFRQDEDESLAVWLDAAGYYTGHVGKYLNGYQDTDTGGQPAIPVGWDEFYGLLDKDYNGALQEVGSTTYNMYKYTIRAKNPLGDAGEYLYDGELGNGTLDDAVYQTEVLGQHAVAFLDNWHSFHYPAGPFFLSVNPSAPHVETVMGCLESNADQMNMRVRPRGWRADRTYTPGFDYGRFRQKTGGFVDEHVPLPGWEPPGWNTGSFNEGDATFAEKPRYLRDNTWDWDGQQDADTARPSLTGLTGNPCSANNPVLDGLKRQHLDRVESLLAVDRMLGDIFFALGYHNVLGTTAIVLASDNGYLLGQHRLVNKQQPYEESIRVPLVIRPPLGDAALVGVSDDSMTVNTDWAPTVLDYAGRNPADYRVDNKPLDGRSLRAVAESSADLARKRILLEHYWAQRAFWDVPDYQGVRTRTPRSLYAEYYNVSAQLAGVKDITDLEYYTDAAQLDNLLDGAHASARHVLAEHLAALAGCSGASCQRAEDRMDFAYRVFLPVVPVQAAAFPAGPGFHTGIAIHNIGTAPADVVVIFQDAASDRRYAYNALVGAGRLEIVIPHSEGLPLGFMGSAVIASDQPVHAVVNLPNKLSAPVGISGGAAQAQYRGVTHDRTAATVRFPLVKHRLGDKSTALVVQNAGHVDATLTATLLCDDGLTYARTYDVAPRKMVVIRPEDVLPPGSASQKCAATITASGNVPIAGASLEYQVVAGTSNPVTPAVVLQAANGFAPADHASRIHFPIVKRSLGGRTTGHQVQNVSGATQTVTITYTASSACPIAPQQATLAPGASATFLISQNLSSCLTTATAVTDSGSSNALVGLASESCSGSPCIRAATTYDAIAHEQLTSKLVAPMYKEDLGGKRTGMMLYNPSSTASAVTVTFTTSAGAVHTCTTSTIGAGQFLVLMDLSASSACTWGAGGALPDGTISSVSAVTVNAGARLAGILNEEALDGTVDAANYEAVNVPR